MKQDQQQVIPVLRIFDIAKAKEFYIDWLGFIIDWEHRFGENFPLYMQISLDDIVFHLTEHYGDCSPGAKVFIKTTGVDELHKKLTAKDYRYYKPSVEIAPWNAKTMELTDPFWQQIIVQ